MKKKLIYILCILIISILIYFLIKYGIEQYYMNENIFMKYGFINEKNEKIIDNKYEKVRFFL